ncbi:MAG: hypothetical protein IKZ53_07995 [Selenomonadaceae bacterium]|nr:hypothetical protein [Selenomonadaceae bacterium]
MSDFNNTNASKIISGSSYADSIYNSGDYVTIDGGDGDDYIFNAGFFYDSTLPTSEKYNAYTAYMRAKGFSNDEILSYGEWFGKQYYLPSNIDIVAYGINSNVSINGNDGNDTIENSGENITISGGAGNDFILNSSLSLNLSVTGGAGNDTIINRGASSFIDGGAGADSVSNTADNVTIAGGNSIDTISNEGAKVSIDGGLSKDKIENSGASSTILGGSGNDTITNSGSDSFIDGGANNDKIINTGSNVTIDGGTGNDSITNDADNVSISGGAGKDYFKVNGFNVTVAGGKGNDKVVRDSQGVNAAYVYSAGNDTLENFGYGNALVLGAVEINSSVWSGDNVKLNLSNGNTLTLKNYHSTKINEVADASNISKVTSTYNDESDTELIFINNGKSRYFVNEGDSVLIEAADSNHYIRNVGTNDVTVKGGAGNDEIYNVEGSSYALLDGGAGHDFIFNDDGEDVSISGGTGDDLISLGSDSENNLILYTSGDGNDLVKGFNETSTLSISGSSYSTTKSGNDIIVTVGKGAITLSGAANLSAVDIKSDTPDVLILDNSSAAKVTIPSAIKFADATARTKAIRITGNKLANSITGGSGSDTLWGSKGNDTLTGGKGKDVFIYNSGKDVITDYASGDKISLGAAITATSLSGDDVIFTIGSGSLTVKNGKAKSLSMINSKGKSFSTIVSGVNTILGSTGKDTLYGSEGDDYIFGNKGNDKLYGQGGNDTLWGGKGNDTLWGGDGSDTFIYKSGEGKDVIVGFDDNDILQITDSYEISKNTAGTEIYFKIGSTAKAITLKDFTATNINIGGSVSYRISNIK